MRISLAVVLAGLAVSLSGCAIQQPEIQGLVSQSSAVPQKDHYEYKGPFQFTVGSVLQSGE